MAEITSENRLKYENYKEQFKRLNKALANGFNLEAMFIEYVGEDCLRFSSPLLRHRSVPFGYAPSGRGLS